MANRYKLFCQECAANLLEDAEKTEDPETRRLLRSRADSLLASAYESPRRYEEHYRRLGIKTQ
jgi:hypothetical protein